MSDWCLIVRTWGDTPATLIVCPTLSRQHHHVAQCCRNIQSSFSMCLGIQKVCLGFKRFHRNINKKYFEKSKNSEKNKIMILGIHYFTTKLKTKIDVIPRGCFKPSRCITASFYIPENRLNFPPTTRGLIRGLTPCCRKIKSVFRNVKWCWKFRMKIPLNTNTWQFCFIFHHALQIIFIHYKSRIATALRGL